MAFVRNNSNGINYANHDFVSVDLHPKNNKNLRQLENSAEESDLCPIWNNYYFDNPNEYLAGDYPRTVTMEQIGVHITSFKQMINSNEEIPHDNIPQSPLAFERQPIPPQQQQQPIPPQQQQPIPPQQQQQQQQQHKRNLIQPRRSPKPIEEQAPIQPPQQVVQPPQQLPIPQQQQQQQKRQTKQQIKLIAPKIKRKNLFSNMNETPQGIKVNQDDNNIKPPTLQPQPAPPPIQPQQSPHSGDQFVQPPQYQPPQFQPPQFQPPQYPQQFQQYPQQFQQQQQFQPPFQQFYQQYQYQQPTV